MTRPLQTAPSSSAVADDGCGCGSPRSRRAFLASALAAVAAACAGPGAESSARRTSDLLQQGAATMAGHPVFDSHAHPGGISTRTELPMTTLGEMQAGGVDAAFFSVVTDAPVISRQPTGRVRQTREPAPGELRSATAAQMNRVLARTRSDQLALVLAPGDVARARQARRRAALLAFEGGDALEGDPARVREYHGQGVRSIQLVHFRLNELGDIQTEPPRHGGLTPAGQGVVAELNRLGMIVDGAHADRATLTGILAASRHPILVSHTGPAALRPRVSRHLPDDLMKAVAAKGGVIGIWPLDNTGAGIDQLVRELDYVKRLVGVEHVGIGTDMAGMATFTSIPTYKEFAPLPAALLARGFSEAEVRQVLGGNLMRLCEAVMT
jgi:membrane dipeptidase